MRNLINIVESKVKQFEQDFENELDNEISISIESKDINDIDGVIISIIGPKSETTNHITKLEAKKLYQLLGEFLSDNKKKK